MTAATSPGNTTSTFVLVHGAWHGGWCWSKVTQALASANARTYAPSLTGLGDRVHLASPAVCLETHIEDIVRVLECERLADVTLVGHSYAGVVVTGVADRVPQRISRVVYLDAVVPGDQQCLFDCAGPAFRAQIEDQVRIQGDGWRISVPDAAWLGLVEDEDVQWVMPRLVPHPYRTFTDRVHLQSTAARSIPRSYINCIGCKAPGGPRSGQADGIEDYYEVPTGHDAMVTLPGRVSELLLRLNESSSTGA
jgi:pimeloyl-ACP methyl ester carboxylesterase